MAIWRQRQKVTSQEVPRVSGNHYKVGKGKIGFFTTALGGSMTLWHLDFRCLACRTMNKCRINENKCMLLKGALFVIVCYGSPRKLTKSPWVSIVAFDFCYYKNAIINNNNFTFTLLIHLIKWVHIMYDKKWKSTGIFCVPTLC